MAVSAVGKRQDSVQRGCWWRLYDKIKQVFSCCIKERKVEGQLLSDHTVRLLEAEIEAKEPEQKQSSNECVTSRCVVATASVIATGAMAYSIYALSSMVASLSERCLDAELASQEAFNECSASDFPSIVINNILLGLSSTAMGYFFQGFLNPSNAHQDSESLWYNKLKEGIGWLQKYCAYDYTLGLIYLYNGISIPVDSPASFASFLNCQTAGVTLGAIAFGMYLKDRAEQDVYLDNTYITAAYRELVVDCLFNTLVLVGTVTCSIDAVTIFPENMKKIVREIGCMKLTKSGGAWLYRAVVEKKYSTSSKCSIASVASFCMKFHVPLTVGSYSAYFLSSSLGGKLAGMGLLGLTQGFMNASSSQAKKPRRAILGSGGAVGIFIKQHWQALMSASFAVLLQSFRFLDCQGPPGPMNYTCPLGLEISGYTNANQLVIDSSGVNIALMAGLAQYTLRHIFKKVEETQTDLTRVAVAYRKASDSLQFDLISLIPYAIAQHEVYYDEIKDVYCFNPITPLLLMGASFGNYKLKSQYEMSTEPLTEVMPAQRDDEAKMPEVRARYVSFSTAAADASM